MYFCVKMSQRWSLGKKSNKTELNMSVYVPIHELKGICKFQINDSDNIASLL